MSSVNEKKKFIAVKLGFLSEQKAHLFTSVNNYVDKIGAAGNSWENGAGNGIGYAELSLQIEDAVELLCLTRAEFSDTAAVLPQDAFQPSLATSTTRAVSHIQTSATARATDDSMLRKVLERIAIMEEDLRSARRNTEKVSDKQDEHENQIKEILSKTAKSDKKQNLKFQEVKEQMTNLTESQTEIRKEQNVRYQSLEKQLQKLSDIQKELRDETINCTQQLESQIADVTCEVEPVKDRINELNFLIDGFTSECSGRIKAAESLAVEVSENVRTNSEALETVSKKVTINTETLEHLTKHVTSNTVKLGNVSEKVTSHTETLGNLTEKVTANSNTLGNLSEKVISNTETLGDLYEKATSNTETLGNLSERVTLSIDRVDTLLETQEQNESSLREFEAKHEEAGAAREAELSKIRLQVVDINTNLGEVMSEVTEVVPRLALLENQASKLNTGFYARGMVTCVENQASNPNIGAPAQDIVTTKMAVDYKRCDSKGIVNAGGHFDCSTGVFTVPVDGRYMVNVSMSNGVSKAQVTHRGGEAGRVEDSHICFVSVPEIGTQCCDFTVKEMKAGDVLFSTVIRADWSIPPILKFSCFRLD